MLILPIRLYGVTHWLKANCFGLIIRQLLWVDVSIRIIFLCVHSFILHTPIPNTSKYILENYKLKQEENKIIKNSVAICSLYVQQYYKCGGYSHGNKEYIINIF